MESDYRKKALGLIRGRVLFDVPMRLYTSMRVGGPADVLFFPRDLDDLRRIVCKAREGDIPIAIIGRGTNLIFRDEGFRGWVISLTEGFKQFSFDGEVVEAEAGLSLNRLIFAALRKNLAGLDPLVGIPGTIGGGLRMNAGAWGSEIKDAVLSVRFMDKNGEVFEKGLAELGFSYRQLDIPQSWIILGSRFRLRGEPGSAILERMRSYREMRRGSQPLSLPSSGCIFKNPKGGSAGKWIEEAGLKGLRIGGAMVSDRHANFIVNIGGATAGDVIKLIELIERKIFEAKGISLEREVKVLGN